MCGIAGILASAGATPESDLRRDVLTMVNRLAYRGPDGVGAWGDASAGVALGHRRLAIFDLSPAGAQPMTSHCGRYVLTFNGEIYNFLELRDMLSQCGHRFHSQSDTEVLLAGFTQWGVQSTLASLNGMFAFGVWDRQQRRLLLARDRFGEKPLYYGWCGGHFLFGSELKALRAHPSFTGRIDRQALALYFRHNYVPSPYSIFQGIAKLPPGTAAIVTSSPVGQAPKIVPYWSLAQIAAEGLADPCRGSDKEIVDQFDGLLRRAVKLRMQSDVPLGAFLSGGLDSSTVVALMQAQSHRAVQTFTIGFNERTHNEAVDAKRIAGHLGTAHTELYVSPEDMLAVIPRLPTLYDEPFSDSSQIPTFLVSQLARRSVTVVLSGDAGDELFAGYTRYAVGQALWRRLGALPAAVRPAVVQLLRLGLTSPGLSAIRLLTPWLPTTFRKGNPAHKLERFIQAVGADRLDVLYRLIVSHWHRPEVLLSGVKEPPTILSDTEAAEGPQDPLDRMMWFDQQTYLPDDILVKVDRASMAVGLEARVPLLDPDVVQFAWRVPQRLKVKDGTSKWLIRELLSTYVPPALTDRPKQGFGVPLDTWLRGPLKDWAATLLDESRLRQQGLLNPEPIRRMWLAHQKPNGSDHYRLWDVVMFQAWLESWDGAAP